MKGRERKDLLKPLPFFDEILPPHLRTTFQGFPLHKAEKHTISVLFPCPPCFLLELDDFVFYIKEQQRVILAPNGLTGALGAKDRSSIPPEMRDELKKIADFQSVF